MMRAGVLIGLAFAACMSVQASAEPASQAEADAAYIAAQMVTEEAYSVSFSAISLQMPSRLSAALGVKGRTPSEQANETLAKMMGNEMARLVIGEMRKETAAIYVDVYSAETLAAYRTFLESDAGQAIARGAPFIVASSAAPAHRTVMKATEQLKDRILTAVRKGRWPDGTPLAVQGEIQTLFVEDLGAPL